MHDMIRYTSSCCCRVLNVSRHIVYSQKRLVCSTSSLLKRDKYALNIEKQKSSGRQGRRTPQNEGMQIVDGKTLSFFKFDTNKKRSKSLSSTSPKQNAYAEVVQQGVESLLSSVDAPEELQEITIEIVQVQVSSSLSSAAVFWRIPSGCQTLKDIAIEAFDKYGNDIRVLLPAYTTLTGTPSIKFIYDTRSEKEEELDRLFELVKDDLQ